MGKYFSCGAIEKKWDDFFRILTQDTVINNAQKHRRIFEYPAVQFRF